MTDQTQKLDAIDALDAVTLPSLLKREQAEESGILDSADMTHRKALKTALLAMKGVTGKAVADDRKAALTEIYVFGVRQNWPPIGVLQAELKNKFKLTMGDMPARIFRAVAKDLAGFAAEEKARIEKALEEFERELQLQTMARAQAARREDAAARLERRREAQREVIERAKADQEKLQARKKQK